MISRYQPSKIKILFSTFVCYTTLTNLSSPILSTCSNHFKTFLSILSSKLNSQPHLSLIILLCFSLCLLVLCHIFFSNTSSQILLFFSSPVHLMTTSPSHKPGLISLLFHITHVLLLWVSYSPFTTLSSSPKPFFPVSHFLPHTPIRTYLYSLVIKLVNFFHFLALPPPSILISQFHPFPHFPLIHLSYHSVKKNVKEPLSQPLSYLKILPHCATQPHTCSTSIA